MSRKNVVQLIDRAKAAGWEYVGRTGASHHRLRWPPTGEMITLSSTPGHSDTSKAQSDLERISGPLVPKPGPGRSKKQKAADARRRQEQPSRKPVKPGPKIVARPPEWKEKLGQIGEQLAVVAPDPDAFTAVCACPVCAHTAVHWLRLPFPAPSPGAWRTFADGTVVMRYDGMTGPDESRFAVIRECRACGHEFGQT